MKNLISIKLGKEKIEIWQIFIFIFLLLMFFVCAFLGYGFLSSARSSVSIVESETTEELSIITDFSKINNEVFNESKLNEYNKNYKKFISDNDGIIKLDNFEFDIFRNIGASIYKININKNGWFLFNNIDKNSDNINEFYIVDNDLNFHKILFQTNTIIKDCTEDPNYENYEVNGFNFFYNKKNDYFYGYKNISEDYDSYFVISGEKIGLSSSDYEKFFKLIDSNITISTNKSYSYSGIALSNINKDIKLSDNSRLDLVTNVNIISLRNGIKKNSNTISLINKKTSTTFNIKEIFKNIDSYSKSTNNNGYLQYKYKNAKIYLKYNIKDYPEFNYTEGGINGVLVECGDHTLLIQFDKNYEFVSQEELENILKTTIGDFLY